MLPGRGGQLVNHYKQIRALATRKKYIMAHFFQSVSSMLRKVIGCHYKSNSDAMKAVMPALEPGACLVQRHPAPSFKGCNPL